jgi:hypothetical protein
MGGSFVLASNRVVFEIDFDSQNTGRGLVCQANFIWMEKAGAVYFAR